MSLLGGHPEAVDSPGQHRWQPLPCQQMVPSADACQRMHVSGCTVLPRPLFCRQKPGRIRSWPALVIKAWNVCGAVSLLMKRTAPSHNATIRPPG